MIFKTTAVKNDKTKTFYYDNIKNFLYDDDGFVYEDGGLKLTKKQKEYTEFSTDIPLKKSNEISTLKIQLGLTCNYSCEYCSQRFVEKAPETSRKHIDDFMDMVKNLKFNKENGIRVEFWGGEPFLYIKTIEPLVKEFKSFFSSLGVKVRYSIISNGSLLTEELCDWIVDNLDGFAISHDGPGQYVRGPDPLEDKKHLELIVDLYKRMNNKKNSGMSFNAMINEKNMSRKAVYEWFRDLVEIEDVKIGEGAFIDAYDEGGLSMSLSSKNKHFEFRKLAFEELFNSDGQYYNFDIVRRKVQSFNKAILGHDNAKYITQKCGMDDENTIAVDLKGNVLTCQNVSYISMNSNGEPHLGGTIKDIENVSLTSSTHWSQRDHCTDCPVLHICRGSCMYAANEYWEQSCDNSYSDNVVFFALAFEQITGYIPIFFDNDCLPDSRKDIWGTILNHEEDKQKNKPFPIPVVAG